MNTELITIRSADLSKAIRVAIDQGLVIDQIYGGTQETLRIGGRKAGPRGNHEPRWSDTQRKVFAVAMGV